MGYRRELWKDGKLIGVHDDRNIEEEKERILDEIKKRASELLSATDWMVLRAAEGGKSVPMEVLVQRDTIRKISDEEEAVINACETLQQLDQCQWMAKMR